MVGALFATGSRAGRTRRRTRESRGRDLSMRETFTAKQARTSGYARARPAKARTRLCQAKGIAGKATNGEKVASRRAQQVRQP